MNKVYEIVLNKVIEQLEKGIIPWNKPWTGTHKAVNHVTGKPYSFINQMLLPEGEYVTFKQANDCKGKVKKGAKSHMVVFWKPYTITETDESGEEVEKTIPILRYYTVFNINDCEGIEPKWNVKREFNPDARAEALINAYSFKQGVVINHEAGDRAFYRPSTDSITLPLKEQFKSMAEYYSTAFHEMTHSTGHASRLNRLSTAAFFGDETYSKEELVAEMGSSFLMAEMELETEKSEKNHAAYCQSWLKALKNDKNMLISAASKAEKAVELIMSCEDAPEETPEASEPAPASEPEEAPKLTKEDAKVIKELEIKAEAAKRFKADNPDADDILNDYRKYAGSSIDTKGFLKAMVDCDLRIAKIHYGAKRVEALKRMIRKDREDIAGVWYDEEGRACFCDGFRACRIEGNYSGAFNVVKGLDLAKIMEMPPALNALEAPDKKELKEYISKEKRLGNKTPLYDFGEGRPAVSAQYLLDLLEIMEDSELAFDGSKKELSSIIFKGSNGDAILLPVRKARA